MSIHEIIRVIMTKIKMKNRSHRSCIYIYIYICTNRSHTYDINKPEISLDMDRNKVNIKSVSV